MSASGAGIQSDPLFQVLSTPSGGANFISPASGQPIVPSNEELSALALLLKFDDKDGEMIKNVAKRDLAFVRAGIRLLDKDPFLRQQLGGGGFRNALLLSGMMKQQFNDMIIKLRTVKMLPSMLQDLGFTSAESIAMITGTGGQAYGGMSNSAVEGLRRQVERNAIKAGQDPHAAWKQALVNTKIKGYGNLALGPKTALQNVFAGTQSKVPGDLLSMFL